jgi:signal transduction histidine kinase/tetratricopeptide (TPR) repeat protein/tRNA A-37 threonylcarbamoyl transferase component Bud32
LLTVGVDASESSAPTGALDDDRVFGGRFRATRRLKEDHDVATLLGTDLEQGIEVVIKTASAGTVPAGVQMRLEHEAEVLRDVRSPFLTSLLHVGREDGLLFLTMPYVPGVTLQRRLDEGSLSVRDAVTVGTGIMAALREAHDKGVLHRDVKPANVIVDESSPLRQVTLIDFGLARSGRLSASIRDLPVGTATYISPEQAGLLHHEVDECADLYSAGVVLFECLAGRPPFEGATVGDVLRQHMTSKPPQLWQRGSPIPRALAEVVQHLLEKDPRDRYQTAEAVAVDLADIAEALGRGESEPRVVAGMRDRRRTLREPAFTGREQELSVLEAELERAAAGRAGLAVLEAESGGGKTRLLDELTRHGAETGAWVLRGQGLDQAAQNPFQVLDGVVREVVPSARQDPAFAARVKERLAGQEEAALAAIPQLGDVLTPTEAGSLGREEHAEARTIRALATLLDSLGVESQPALVLLDDCQWADGLTIDLIRSWFEKAREDGVRRYILLVLAFRSDEVAPASPLRKLHPSARIALPPLDAADCRRLAESMSGPLPDEAVELVSRLSGGSPFMAAELLRGLVETGALSSEPSGWSTDPRLMSDAQSSRRAAVLIARRLEQLAGQVLRLLSVGAVLGKEFDLDFAGALAKLTPGEATAAAQEARRRHIVWADAQGASYAFVHDRLREALLERLSSEDRKALHRLAAVRTESLDPERVFEIAYHFDAGGARDRALPYALAAAERARSRNTLEIAEQQCRIAKRAARFADDDTRRRIAELLGDVLMLRGRYAEAENYLLNAVSLARSETARAQIEGKIGELAFKRGDVKTSSDKIEHALELLGQRVPRTRAALYVMVVREVFAQALHTLFRRVFLSRRRLDGAESEFLAIRLYSGLAYAYWFQRGRIPCAWAHLRGMNLAERYPPTAELAQAYSEHAPVMTMIPYFRRGVAYAERSLAIRKQLGDRWGQGQSLNFYGVVLYAASRFSEAIEKCREAVAILERTGDPWEANTAGWHIAFCQYRKGDLREAVITSKRVHQLALQLGDNQVASISLGVWAKAAGGRVPRELVHAELRHSGEDVHAAAEVLQAEALRLLAEGRPGAAVEVLEDAQRRVQAAGLRQEYVAPVLPWLATALRCEAQTVPTWDPARRDELSRRAQRAARKGLRTARSYRNNLPHVLRENALLAAMRGRPRRARRLFDRSLVIAERQGARYEHAQTLLARGEVGLSLGWSNAEAEITAALRALGRMGAEVRTQPDVERHAAGESSATGPDSERAEVPTLSLLDRFSVIVESGRRIVSALSKEAVFSAAHDAALTLLRAEHCFILELEKDSGEPRSAGANGTYSRTLVERGVAAGRPVALDRDLDDDPSESLTISGIRSAICAPIHVRGQAAACLYATHERVGGLFGDGEKRLAEFIAVLAGAALENAEGFAEVEALSGSLERRASELERSNADLQQFAHAASHDLSEPLRMVSSYLQLLAKRYQGKLDSDADEFIGFAVDGAVRMQALIDGLLTYSRAGTAEYALGPVDCSQVVRESLVTLEARIKETDATITADPLPTVRGDATQLGQLFQNLLSNAIKFVASGAPLVHVSAEKEPTGWRFTVTDNGVGVEPRHVGRIFTVFQRLHSRESYPGSGIGLAICKRVVERHGGRIWLEPGPDVGSRFCFTIPDEESA